MTVYFFQLKGERQLARFQHREIWRSPSSAINKDLICQWKGEELFCPYDTTPTGSGSYPGKISAWAGLCNRLLSISLNTSR